MVPSHMQITHAVGTDAPPFHHRGWFLHFSLVTVWMVIFIFHVESNVCFSQKQAEMWTLTREHIYTVFWSISDNFGPRELGGISA